MHSAQAIQPSHNQTEKDQDNCYHKYNIISPYSAMNFGLRRFAMALSLVFCTAHSPTTAQSQPLSAAPTEIVNPTAARCQGFIEQCGLISIGPYSLQLRQQDVSQELDGSLSIEALATWQNQGSFVSTSTPIRIRLAPMLWPFPAKKSAQS
jgi:hypothetical protein